jgi:glycosyltransferase involved in cell wall biosynthesis
MRILNSVLGDASGGRWRVVCDYSRELHGHGHQVSMLLSRKQQDLRRIPPGVEVQFVRSHGHYDYPAAWRVRRQLRRFRPQFAIAHCSRSVALLKRALAGSAPLLAVSHSNKVRRLLPADAYLVLSEPIRARLVSEAGGVLHKPCFVIPNMIDTGRVESLPPPARGAPPCLVALGRFDVVKGLDVFAQALAILRRQGRRFTATLGGAGREEQTLRRLATRLDLSDTLDFPGWVEDVGGLLRNADLLCVPARSDAFGLTPLQGAIAGVPLVLSRATGHLEMFQPEVEALFFDVDDTASCARQMARLLADVRLAERIRAAAFERVSRCYSVPAVSQQIMHAVETVSNIFYKNT